MGVGHVVQALPQVLLQLIIVDDLNDGDVFLEEQTVQIPRPDPPVQVVKADGARRVGGGLGLLWGLSLRLRSGGVALGRPLLGLCALLGDCIPVLPGDILGYGGLRRIRLDGALIFGRGGAVLFDRVRREHGHPAQGQSHRRRQKNGCHFSIQHVCPPCSAGPPFPSGNRPPHLTISIRSSNISRCRFHCSGSWVVSMTA